ncbi:MAG: sigma 54-interacting transcriptional regulator [Bacteroidota bacterium]
MTNPARKNIDLITKIIIVGAGKGGRSLIEFFLSDPSVEIVMVIDIDKDAEGIKLAREAHLPTHTNVNQVILTKEVEYDIIIEVTNNTEVHKDILAIKPDEVRMISGVASKFLWALLEERSNNMYLQDRYSSIKEVRDTDSQEMIFGSSDSMVNLEKMIDQVAPTNSTVLFIGETGTGKELAAETIYHRSALKDKPFIKVNCTAFSADIIESELFGHVKGAFTGALSTKKGMLEMADRGTLFLDEIGDIPMAMQVKLLRFIQFGEVRPVGSNETKIINTRLIAATNQHLEEKIKEGGFRQDLFFRLNTFTLELPALRHRKEDLPLYIYHFLKKGVLKLNKKVERVSSNALNQMIQYGWPGNLRELQAVIERAIILTNTNKIQSKHLPMSIQSENLLDFDKGFRAAREMVTDDFEKHALHHYLNKSHGNVSMAADYAKMPRRTFYRLLNEHEVDPDQFKGE